MWAHRNASAFFSFYAIIHTEFDSWEQIEKRNRLAVELEKDLFEKVKSDGLEEPIKNKKTDKESSTGSPPKINK